MFLIRMTKANYFNNIILLFIFFSSIHLALDNPLNDPNGKMQYALFIVDLILTSIFVIEALIKIIAYGFLFNGKESYMRNYWNLLDFIIIFFSVFSISSPNINLSIFKIFRLLRILRPLRIISRNKGLKVKIN